jgi:hypothetical protein
MHPDPQDGRQEGDAIDALLDIFGKEVDLAGPSRCGSLRPNLKGYRIVDPP